MKTEIKHMAIVKIMNESGLREEYYLCNQAVAPKADKLVHDWNDVTCWNCLAMRNTWIRNMAQDRLKRLAAVAVAESEAGPGQDKYMKMMVTKTKDGLTVSDADDSGTTPGHKDRLKRLSDSCKSLDRAEANRRLRHMERCWIQDTPKIHAFNYWYYRYFTDAFELYMLAKYHEVKR